MTIPTYEGIVTAISGSATSLTPDISGIDGGSAPTDGDLLIAHLGVEGSTATSAYLMYPPGDWHHLATAQNNYSSGIYWKIWRSGDDTTPTFGGWPASNCLIGIHCLRGADQARPICRHSVNRHNSTDFNWLSETTPVPDCLALATGVCTNGISGWTPASGWTERADFGAFPIGMYAQTQGFASASSSTGTASVNRGAFAEDFVDHMLVIQEAQTETPRDIRVKTGSSLSPTSTGNQDITGLGFDVKALIVYIANKSSDSVSANVEFMRGIGADDGVTAAAQRSAGVWHTSGGDVDQGYSANGSIIKMYFQGNTTLGSPDLQATFSRITDGFRLNWTAVQGSAVTFNWIALGGADLRAVAGAVQVSAGAVTSLPWRPDLVHTIGQNVDSDSDQIRAAGLLQSGWLDCQAGAAWYQAMDMDNGDSTIVHRDSGFAGQMVNGGTLTWEAAFEQTTSSGWTWQGTNTDYFQYLALRIAANDTAFPYQVESLRADTSGTGGADQTLPSFADGQTYGEKQLIHVIAGDDTTAVNASDSQWSEGHVEFDGGSGFVRDQDCFSNARTGNTSERNRKTADAFLLAATGDLNSPGKIGRFTDEDTIDWSTNNAVGYLIGLATIGFIGQEYDRTVNDTGAVTDQVAAEMTFERSAADAIAVTDQITVELEYGPVASDAIAVTDQIATELTYERTLNDTVDVTDELQAATNYARTVSDAIAVTDQVAAEMTFERSAADAIAVTDQVAAEMTFERAVSDAVDVTDQLQAETDYVRTLNDTVDVTDQLTAEVTFERSASDTIEVTDQLQAQKELDEGASDTIEVTDQLTVEVRYSRTVNDAIAVTDFIPGTGSGIARTVNDQVTVIDLLRASTQYAREVTDTIALTDAISATMTFERAASDAIAVVDQVVIEQVHIRFLSDTVAVTDQLMVEMSYGPPVGDTISVTDQLKVEMSHARTVVDAVDVTDQVVVEAGTVRAATDTISVTDQLKAATSYARAVSDALAVTDAIQTSVTYERTLADVAGVTDALTVEMTHERALADAIDVTDQLATEHDANRIVNDTVEVTDQLTAATAYAREVSDAVGVTDQLTAEVTYDRTTVDTVDVTDELQRVVWFARTVNDAIETSDAVDTEGGTLIVVINDTIGVTDQLSAEVAYDRTSIDAISVVDQLATEVTLGGYASDTIDVTDQITAFLIQGATESIEMTDQLQVEVWYAREASDAVEVEDQVLEGDPVLVVHSIDGGATAGPAGVRTVSPTGPLSISGSPDCVTAPVGFVIELGDHIECTDRLQVAMVHEVVINDSVEVVD